MTLSTNSSDCLIAHWASGIPALLIKVFTTPKESSVICTAFLMLSLSTISTGMGSQVPPSSLISLANSSNLSTLLAEMATLAPHLANTFANL